MKYTVCKNSLGLLILAASSLPFTTYAAESTADVVITATVDATVSLDVEKTFDLGNKTTTQDLDIKTKSNGPAVTLEISQNFANDDHIVLKNGSNIMNVRTTLGNSTDKFNTNHILSMTLPASNTEQTTKLHLTPVHGKDQVSGTYTATVHIKAKVL